MVRHAPIHRRSGHSDIAICCGRNVRGSSPSTSVVPLSNQVTTLNHKRFKGFKMFSDGHLGAHHKAVIDIRTTGTIGALNSSARQLSRSRAHPKQGEQRESQKWEWPALSKGPPTTPAI